MRFPDPSAPAMTEEDFRLLRDVIHEHCGLWYRDESLYLLEKRLQPRLQALGQAPADVVSRAAGHPDPEVVKEAVAAAARLPGPEGETLLRQAAQNPRWDVRQAAARAMLERGDPALRAAAAELAARETDPLVARAFADAAQALSGR